MDVAGNTLEDQDDHFNYGLKMMGNYTFPSLNYTYMAPGGQSTFQDDDGKYYIHIISGLTMAQSIMNRVYIRCTQMRMGGLLQHHLPQWEKLSRKRGTKIGCIRYILCSKPWNRYQQ